MTQPRQLPEYVVADSFYRDLRKYTKNNPKLKDKVKSTIERVVECFPGPFPKGLGADQYNIKLNLWSFKVTGAMRLHCSFPKDKEYDIKVHRFLTHSASDAVKHDKKRRPKK